jgi:uncharacterized protein
MEFAWDPAKDEANHLTQGLRLEFGKQVCEDPDHAIVETFRIGDEEDRFKAIGLVEGKFYTAIHVYRGKLVRLISVRRSNSSEQRDYDSDPG